MAHNSSSWVSDFSGHKACTYFTCIHVDNTLLHINEKKGIYKIKKTEVDETFLNAEKGEHLFTVGGNMNVQIIVSQCGEFLRLEIVLNIIEFLAQ